MSSVEELLKSHGLTRDEVLKWGKEKYPTLIGNEALLVKLYLVTHGVKLPMAVPRGRMKKITELKEREPSVVNVVVVQQVAKSRYFGCPSCYIKLDALGGETECPRCGTVVQPKELFWSRYLVGDSSGEIIMSLSPSSGVSDRDLPEGAMVEAYGSLRENGEFLARRLVVHSQPIQMVEVGPKPIVEEVKEVEKVEEIVEEGKVEEKVEEKLEKPAVLPEEVVSATPLEFVPTDVMVKYVKVGGMLRKNADEFFKLFKEKFPEAANEEMFKVVLQKAGCKIQDGKVVLSL